MASSASLLRSTMWRMFGNLTKWKNVSTQKIHRCGIHQSAFRLHREGTELERKEEKRRKRDEIVLFKELADYKKSKDKETFMQAISIYESKQSVYRRGHVDFILGAVEQMKEFDVHKDIEVYKALMKVFPEGEMVAKSVLQAEFMHFPRQQNTAMEVLTAMSNSLCIPDDEMGDIIISRFGKNSYVMKRYQRMMYWMPKFRHMSPYPLPLILPKSSEELAVLALKRMAVDSRNEVAVYYSTELELTNNDTFIASACSPAQRELMVKHDSSLPLYVEGGFLVWVRDQSLIYFILRADPRPEILKYNKPTREEEEEEEEDEDIEFFSYLGENDEAKRKTALIAEPSVHEQPEGTILAMCITGNSSKDSLLSWLNFLQRENPSLYKVPVVFSLRTPESGVQPTDYQTAGEEASRIESGSSDT